MVKRWIFVILLLIVLSVGCVLEHRFLDKSFGGLINNLETLQIELVENKESIDSEHLIAKANDIHKVWHKDLKKIKCLIWHTWVKDIEIGLARIAVYVSENNYTEAYAEIGALIDYASHYLKDFKISLENILWCFLF